MWEKGARLRMLACLNALSMVLVGCKPPTDLIALLQTSAKVAQDAPSISNAELPSESPLNPWTYRPDAAKMPPSGDFLEHNRGKACAHQRAGDVDVNVVPEYAKWRFQPPKSTEWLQFDGPALCQKLIDDAHIPGKPRMLFVGDSRSREQMQALMLYLPPYATWEDEATNVAPEDLLPRAWELKGNGPQKNYGAFACGGQLWLQQQGSLGLAKDYVGEFRFKEHVPWLQSFDVVVLQLPFQGQETRPGDVLDFWRGALLPRQRLLLRTASIGHESTGALYNSSWDDRSIASVFKGRPHRAPFQSPDEVVAYFQTIKGHGSWMKLRKRQEHSIVDLERRKFTVADYYWISAMMWDRHKDPLHYCFPGPTDRWNDILFNWVMRGHIRDFQAWSNEFSDAVLSLGGLHNVNGDGYSRTRPT